MAEKSQKQASTVDGSKISDTGLGVGRWAAARWRQIRTYSHKLLQLFPFHARRELSLFRGCKSDVPC